jgi:ATP-dependent exoDNAse (exonuclease V) alpha subunit
LSLRNRLLKLQFNPEACSKLSDLKLQWGCIPFDEMPFCTSLVGHNPRYWDLIESLDIAGREHELLARRVKTNVQRHGMLYTPVADLASFGDTQQLLAAYNKKLYFKHQGRRLMLDKGHVFIREYEDSTVAIIERLQAEASIGVDGYAQAVDRWLRESGRPIDDPVKKEALGRLFSESRVALIYGAAGTGKTTMMDHIANYFHDESKLFLANTNPAVDNMKRRVTAQCSTFRTISSQTRHRAETYDLLVIDECSTVSNGDLVDVLAKVSFKLLVLVGDVYQIEAIEFGNWFGLARSFVPTSAVFELTQPFRTDDQALLALWDKVRRIDDDIAEAVARGGYSSALDASLFGAQHKDEIILCLNYDGLYGINNVNRFLQSRNPEQSVSRGAATYKVGDPVLFNETDRFYPLIYNNLKGWIVGIQESFGEIQFDIKLDRRISEVDVVGGDLQWVRDSTVRFSVYDYGTGDEDDDSVDTIVPFQVAYAVSIHKAQGLEYDSVKIVITDANEDDITHNILYTAITRAREHLQVYWTPETQQAILTKLRRHTNPRDGAILSSRRSLKPVT